MVLNRCLHPPGPIFYRPNVAELYLLYEYLSRAYTGWTLTEIKSMPARERAYWIEGLKWRANQRDL